MKKVLSLMVVMTYILTAGGVANIVYAQETKTGEGAIMGGLLGAVAGGIIGNQKHKAGQGALIGGAVGALGGAVVGSQMKSQTAAGTTATPAVATSTSKATASTDNPVSKVTMKQVIYWTEQGIPSDEIISRIDKAGATFSLTADDIQYLEKQGVSQRVIEAMQEKI